MDNQEWFERFKTNLRYDEKQVEYRFYDGGMWINERWKIIQTALFKMALHGLSPLERQIVQLIFFGELSERGVAQKLKMPKTKVHRIKETALNFLSKSPFVKLALSPRIMERRVAA